MGELEKLGSKYRVALRYSRYLLYNISFTSFSLFLKTCIMVIYFISRIARDPRFKRLPCLHKGTYADDCIVKRITQVSLGSQQKITLLHAAHFTSLISDILISFCLVSQICSKQGFIKACFNYCWQSVLFPLNEINF